MAVSGDSSSLAPPWGDFACAVSTLSGGPRKPGLVLGAAEIDGPTGAVVWTHNPHALTADYWAQSKRKQALWAALQDSALAAVLFTPLQRLVVAYARDALELLVSDGFGVRAVCTLTGAVRTVRGRSHIQMAESLLFDPHDGALVASNEWCIWRRSADVARRTVVRTDSDNLYDPNEVIAGAPTLHYSPGNADGHALTTARLSYPMVIVSDSARGEVVFADMANNKIRRLDTARGVVTTIAGSGEERHTEGDALTSAIYGPRGGVVDPLQPDHLLLFAFGTQNLCRFDRRKSTFTIIRLRAPPPHFAPVGLCATPSGWLLMSCVTHSVYAVDSVSGHIAPLAGAASVAADSTATKGYADGPAAVARFRGPWGVTADALEQQCAWVSDGDNESIRRITLPPLFALPPSST